MQRLNKILKVLFIVPFSIGNPDVQSSNSLDSSDSVVVLFSCLVSIIIVVVGTFSGLHRFNEASIKVIWGLIVTLVTIATINIFLIFYRIHAGKSPVTFIKDNTDGSSQLQLKFLWLFGLGLILRTSLTIAADIDCLDKNVDHVYYLTSAISSLMMIIFVLSLIGLITYMKKKTFLRLSWIFFSIGVVLLTNASIWLNFATVGISGILHRAVNSNISAVSAINNSSYSFCFFHSKISSFSTKIQPYLFQISLDFLFLATLFIVKTLPTFQSLDVNRTLPNVSEETDSNMLRSDHKRTGIVSMAIGIICHIPFPVMALMIRFVFLANMNTLREVWQVGVIIQKSTMLILIFTAFSRVVQRKTDPCSWKFSTTDCILLSCCTGKIVVHTFGILAATSKTIKRSLLCKSLVSLVFYFYQTLYIMITRRSAQTAINQSNVSVCVHVLLFTLNITQWTTTTFILSVEGNYVLNEGVGRLFENRLVWEMLQYTIIPFTLYYDFQSAMHFHSILPNFGTLIQKH